MDPHLVQVQANRRIKSVLAVFGEAENITECASGFFTQPGRDSTPWVQWSDVAS